MEWRGREESQKSHLHSVLACSRSGDICEDLMYFLKTRFLLTSTVGLEKFGQDMLAHRLDLTLTMGS